MTSGLVNASFSLPERQAVKMIFFAPWQYWRISVIWQAENRQYNGFFWGKLACNKFETFQWQRQYCHYGYGGNRKFSLTEWVWHFKNQESLTSCCSNQNSKHCEQEGAHDSNSWIPWFQQKELWQLLAWTTSRWEQHLYVTRFSPTLPPLSLSNEARKTIVSRGKTDPVTFLSREL